MATHYCNHGNTCNLPSALEALDTDEGDLERFPLELLARSSVDPLTEPRAPGPGAESRAAVLVLLVVVELWRERKRCYGGVVWDYCYCDNCYRTVTMLSVTESSVTDLRAGSNRNFCRSAYCKYNRRIIIKCFTCFLL